uniref:Uncharacterized protein n=1 Tax=Panagrellus redivivus TaxID=6233 RepID=A0A7E4VT95_PANRE
MGIHPSESARSSSPCHAQRSQQALKSSQQAVSVPGCTVFHLGMRPDWVKGLNVVLLLFVVSEDSNKS